MTVDIRIGDCRDLLKAMPSESVHCVVTSPPYWVLRDYGVDGQIGLEKSLTDWIAEMVSVFAEVRRVLRKDGTVWLNLGDGYSASGNGGHKPSETFNGHTARHGGRTGMRKVPPLGLKPKDLMMMPARVALALQADGWYLRSEIVWAKPNPMPESVTDRPTSAHEKIYLLSKSPRYYYDAEAVRTASDGFTKMPDGWDTGPGAHGKIHRQGREKGKTGVCWRGTRD